jgi:hypothetical protein
MAPDRYLILSRLYILAETLVDETTEDAVLDELQARCEELNGDGMHNQPSLLTLWTIYDGTKEKSRIREWLVDLYTTRMGNDTPLNLLPIVKDFPQPFLADLFTTTITFCPLPGQLKSIKKEVTEAKAQAQAHLNAKLQLSGHFARKKEQLLDKLAKTHDSWKGACKGMTTMQSSRDQAQRAKATLEESVQRVRGELGRAKDDKAALEDDLRKARTEVDMLKRRPVNTLTTSSWDRQPQIFTGTAESPDNIEARLTLCKHARSTSMLSHQSHQRRDEHHTMQTEDIV